MNDKPKDGKKVRLTRPQAFILESWLIEHKEEIGKGKYTDEKIVELLRDKVSPELSSRHVRSARNAHGIKSLTRAKVKGKKSAKRIYSSELRTKIVRAISRQLVTIRDALNAAGVTFVMDPMLEKIAASTESLRLAVPAEKPAEAQADGG